MKDSTKKRLIIAGLAAVSVLLIFGISRVLYKEPVQELPGLSTLFQTNFFRLFFRYCTGV